MESITRRMIFGLISFSLILTAVLFPAQPAQATTPPYEWSNWEIYVDFPPDNSVRAQWIVRVGHYTTDSTGKLIATPTNMYQEFLSCSVHGTATVNMGVATLDNSTSTPGYIQCTVPSYKTVVDMLTGNTFAGSQQDPSCKAGIQRPWGGAYVQLHDSDSPNILPGFHPTASHPIIYHPDVNLSTDVDSSTNRAQTQLAFDHHIIQSSPFHIQPWNDLWSGYGAESVLSRPEFWAWAKFIDQTVFTTAATVAPASDSLHWANSSQISPHQPPMPSFSLTQASTTVYIGHNPVDGSYFDGEIRAVSLDPGCFGQN